MGKKRVIAETGAGQHGVATATVAARLGPFVHGLHGHRGYGAAAVECESHAAARGGSDRRGCRKSHAERRDQRSHARLGDQRARRRITCWVRCLARIRIRRSCAIFRRSSVKRRASKFMRAERPAAGSSVCMRRRRLEFHRPLSRISRAIPSVKMVGVEAGGRGKSLGGSRGEAGCSRRICRRSAWRPARHLHVRAAIAGRADRRRRIPFPPGSITRQLGPNTRGSRNKAAPNTRRCR